MVPFERAVMLPRVGASPAACLAALLLKTEKVAAVSLPLRHRGPKTWGDGELGPAPRRYSSRAERPIIGVVMRTATTLARVAAPVAGAACGAVFALGFRLWLGPRRHAGAAFEEKARLASVVESSDDAIMAVSLDGTVMSWNGGAERLYGYTAEEFVGRNVSELAPPDRMGEAPPVLAKVRRGESVGRYETECIIKDGRRRAIALTVSPVRGPSGGVVGAAAIVRDVTEGRRTAERLRRSETRLAMAQRVAGLGTWEYDVAGDEAWWSDELYLIYGFDPEEVTPTLGKLMDVVHPEDEEDVKDYTSSLPSEGERDGIEHRIVRPDGEVRFIQNLRTVERDASGGLTKVVGTVQNVSER